jgi:hypothetical protein
MAKIEVKTPKVNPRVREFEIGVRSMRDIFIWPLSLADEISFSEKILGLVEGYDEAIALPLSDEGEELIDNVELRIAGYILGAIKENLIELLAFVTEEEVTLNDIDNEQFLDLCDTIYEMNFEGAVGKGKRLLIKIKSLFPQKTQSENLFSDPVTDMNTSTDSATETEE